MKRLKGENSLSHYDQQPACFTSLHPLLKEARIQNMWLYNRLSGNWYTPDEFEEKYREKQYTNYDMEGMLRNVSIRNPIAGIRAYHKKLNEKLEAMNKETEELRIKSELFNKKVIEYYQKQK